VRVIDGVNLYTVLDAGKAVRRKQATINKWYKYSQMVRGEQISKAYIGQPLMPICIRINGIKYWDKEGLNKIIEFSKKIKRGSMAHFNISFWEKETAKDILLKKEIKREKEREEIRLFRGLPLCKQDEVRILERLKYLKKEARKRSKKTISYTLKTAPK